MRTANKQVIFTVIITEGDESPPSLVSKPEFKGLCGRIIHRCGDLESLTSKDV